MELSVLAEGLEDSEIFTVLPQLLGCYKPGQAGRGVRILLAAGPTKETCGSGCDNTRHSDWAAVRAPRNRSQLQQKQNSAASSIAGTFLKCALLRCITL